MMKVKFKISQSKLGKGRVRVRGRSDEGQMMVKWSGEFQVSVRGMSCERQIPMCA